MTDVRDVTGEDAPGAVEGVDVDSHGLPADRPGAEAEQDGSALDDLEAEGDVAADYLEELLDIVDLDGDIDIFVENGRPSLAIVADGVDRSRLQMLVGRDGGVLDALQDLTRLAVQTGTGRRSRLLLDIGGWREARRGEAAAAAEAVIAEVRSGATSGIELAPMPAYQRKVVHDLVARAGLRSESAGLEPERRVVVYGV